MPASYEYNKEYAKKYLGTQDEIKIRVPKGTKEDWKAAAEAMGAPSLQRFIIDAVEAAITENTPE